MRAGEIAGKGTLPNGDLHAYVLIPCKAGTKVSKLSRPVRNFIRHRRRTSRQT